MEIRYGRSFGFVPEHNEADEGVSGYSMVNNLHIDRISYHDGSEDSGKNWPSHQRHQRELIGKDLVYGYYTLFCHGINMAKKHSKSNAKGGT